MVVLALSTGHKLGLLGVALLFIAFALASSFLLPRYDPDFPGRRGLRLFVLATLVLFVAMMAAVTVLAKEPEEGHAATEAGGGGSSEPGGGSRVAVTAKDFRFELPTRSVSAGSYTFELKNTGKSQHNLVVDGPGVSKAKTPLTGPGKTAALKVTLKSGTYELYCSVPGHKQLGMDVKLKVT